MSREIDCKKIKTLEDIILILSGINISIQEDNERLKEFEYLLKDEENDNS